MAGTMLLLALSVLVTTALALTPDLPRRQKLKDQKPNIILILTDDQDVELGSLSYMPKTDRLLRKAGADFRHAYVTTPMCCPSRSSILTGIYVHNHQVFTNSDNCTSPAWQATYETRTFAAYLSNEGYRTAYFGKYLNKYNGSYIPPGWREWGGLIMNSKFYNYSVNHNGKRMKHGFDYSKDYYPDLIANDSMAFLRQSRKISPGKPFMLVMSFPSPHGPEDAAPQYADMFFNTTSHHTPAYNHAPNPDKQWILQVTKPMQPIHKQFTDLLMTKRLQTLQSVDDAVEKVVNELTELEELNNTYIFYTSDHGYHLGQFGLVKGKSFPFEFDVRVPFFVRGPGIEPYTELQDIALNIDLAPTFLDIAGIAPQEDMDGRSLLPLLIRRPKYGLGLAPRRKRMQWPDSFVIESSGRRESGERESGMSRETQLHLTSKSERLAEECRKEKFQSPCQINQKWVCILEDGRWRKHKCKLMLSRRKKNCICLNGENAVLSPLDQEERRMQRAFLAGRTSKDLRDYRPKFLRTIRSRRETAMRRHRRHMQSIAGCEFSSGFINCNDSVYNDPAAWKAAKEALDLEYRQIRELLNQLKEIRRHLKLARPSDSGNSEEDEEDEAEGDEEEDYDDTIEETFFIPPTMTPFNENRSDDSSFITPHDTSLNKGPTIPSFETSVISGESDNTPEGIPNIHVTNHIHNFSQSTTPTFDSSVQPDLATEAPHYLAPNLHNSTKYKGWSVGGHRRKQNGGSKDIPNIPMLESHCLCETRLSRKQEIEAAKEAQREARRRIKEERLLRKERKLRRRIKLSGNCFSEKMNCFQQDNDHWRTPPLWTGGPFCFCMNANNNTYSCLRTINSTHNFLYCEFITGFRAFYNLRIDPYQLQNFIDKVKPHELEAMQMALEHLKKCRGARDCTFSGGQPALNTFKRRNNNFPDSLPGPGILRSDQSLGRHFLKWSKQRSWKRRWRRERGRSAWHFPKT